MPKPPPQKRGTKYAWVDMRELTPGEAFQAFKGRHYTCESRSFAGQLYKMARERDWSVTVAVFPTTVIFAFYQTNSYLRPNMRAFPVVLKLRRRFQ